MSTLTYFLIVLWIIIFLIGVLFKRYTHQKVKDIESNIVIIQKQDEQQDIVATIQE